MADHIHEWQIGIIIIEGKDLPKAAALCEECDELMDLVEIERRLNDTEWLYRMSNENIAFELSVSWELPLHITRGIAGWILEDAPR